MAGDPIIVIRFKGLEEASEGEPDGRGSDALREHLEARSLRLAQEFPETTHYEISVAPDHLDYEAHALARGSGIDLAAHAKAADARAAGEAALDRLERELRREHDKRIFSRRREAQKSAGRRRAR